MHDPSFDPASLFDALIRIRHAGRLTDLATAVEEAAPKPPCDVERWPDFQASVEELAAFASGALGLPLENCQDAFCQRLLPSTRRSLAIEVILEFDAQLTADSQ